MNKFGDGFRDFISLILLLTSTWSVFYLFRLVFLDKLLFLYEPGFTIKSGKALFSASCFFALFIGSLLVDRVNKEKFMRYWIIIGIVSILLVLFHSRSNISFICIFLGFSNGLGLPSCLAYFSDYIEISKRGKYAGIIQLILFLLVPILIFFSSYFNFSLKEYVIMLLFVKSFSLIPFIFQDLKHKNLKSNNFIQIFTSRNFYLYFIPWVIFSFTNGLLNFAHNYLKKMPEYSIYFGLGPLLEISMAGIFGIVSGLAADRYGRKQPLIIGFIILGIGYAIVGIISSPISWFIHDAFAGIAWGIILICFQWLILGDFSGFYSADKYYALGISIPLAFEAITLFLLDKFNLELSPNLVGSFFSIVLFISVFPLLLAKETLPEDKIKDIQFKKYLEKVFGLLEKEKKN
ncbi:MAG: MFS transporter [Candidatus Thorarchaeota archaeon]